MFSKFEYHNFVYIGYRFNWTRVFVTCSFAQIGLGIRPRFVIVLLYMQCETTNFFRRRVCLTCDTTRSGGCSLAVLFFSDIHYNRTSPFVCLHSRGKLDCSPKRYSTLVHYTLLLPF